MNSSNSPKYLKLSSDEITLDSGLSMDEKPEEFFVRQVVSPSVRELIYSRFLNGESLDSEDLVQAIATTLPNAVPHFLRSFAEELKD